MICDEDTKIQIVTTLNSSCDNTQKLNLGQYSKNKIATKLEKSNWEKIKCSNCDKTQTVTKVKHLHCDKTWKLQFWQNFKNQVVTKFKNSNCDKSQDSSCDKTEN